MKKQIKKFFRIFGIEISFFNPATSAAAQQVKALNMLGVDILFDIGANEGQFAREMREYGYKGTIVSFEPLTSARKKLLRLASDDPSWEVHKQLAIGDQDAEIELNVAGNSVSSSVLPMLKSHSNAAVGSAYVDSESVPVARLDSVSGSYLSSESKLFIKIDTQGFEWQVFDGAYETLKQARGVMCELSLVDLYEGQRLWRDIVERLENDGFILWALQKGFTNPRTGQTLQMDGIFLRRDVLME